MFSILELNNCKQLLKILSRKMYHGILIFVFLTKKRIDHNCSLSIYSMPTKVPCHPLNFGTVAATFINVVSRYSKLDMRY